jgi:hypothetical protein
MTDFFQQMSAQMGAYVPNLIGALAILLGGFLLAWVLSALLKAALNRTTIDNKIASFLHTGSEPVKDVEGFVSTAVFYILMVFVAIAFLQALGLTLLVQPLNNMLDKLLQFIPKVAGVALLLGIAWVIATTLRLAVRRAMGALKLEERLGTPADGEKSDAAKKRSLGETVAEVMYWLVFLLFLPAVVDTLGMTGALVPLQTMIGKFLGFLPNLFGAIVIFIVGWFLARIVQRIASSLLAAAGANRLTEAAGMEKVLGDKKLSDILGLVLHALIMLPVLVASLDALGLENVTRPVSGMLNKILAMLPNIFGAFLVLAIAFFVGKAVSAIVTNVLTAAGFNTFLSNLGLKRGDETAAPGEASRTPAQIVGTLVLLTMLMFASVEAARLLTFDALAGMITEFMTFAGHVLMGLVVFVIGLYFSNIAASIVAASSHRNAKFLAGCARVGVILLVTAMALRQTNIANEIINLAFGLTLGAVAVAVALMFGLGGREVAAKTLASWSESLEKNPSGPTPAAGE